MQFVISSHVALTLLCTNTHEAEFHVPFHFEFNTCNLSLFALHEKCTFTWTNSDMEW